MHGPPRDEGKRPKGMADIDLAASFNKSLAKGYDLEQCLVVLGQRA